MQIYTYTHMYIFSWIYLHVYLQGMVFFLLGVVFLLCICVRVLSYPQNVFLLGQVLTVLFVLAAVPAVRFFIRKAVCFTLEVAFLLLEGAISFWKWLSSKTPSQ